MPCATTLMLTFVLCGPWKVRKFGSSSVTRIGVCKCKNRRGPKFRSDVACLCHSKWRGNMGFVPCVSELETFGWLKFQLECDMCYLFDRATCLLLIFLHVALLSSMDGGAPDGHSGCTVLGHEVWRLNTPEEMVHDGMAGRKFWSS